MSGGISGLGYIAWRLKGFGATAGQVSFMYLLRYVITICANQFQTIVAIAVLLIVGGLSTGAYWTVWVTAAVCVGILALIAIAIAIASSRKRIDWFAKISTKFINFVVKNATFGHRKNVLSFPVVHKYFIDLLSSPSQFVPRNG